ncbi:MAG TPA: tRNA (adenosine(37)-N6)-threonylcarbamoyltransferase complex dimerization subunit type 1 TsaB [Steroidobacteraceae bacterium]|nr:tRNA (adenosine(37)-N6)-threonylcarbamoyltransferase complex dimerization subunit type 1 TsaB [Steroidobacteraceae bacterium]
MRILALDTATEACSVALLQQVPPQPPQTWVRDLPPGPGHSAHILSLVQGVLEDASTGLHELDCIAFGRGPGGFTGVRLAASVTQGLAFGARLPVIPVSDLLAVAQQALDLAPAAQGVVICNDARMQEVYFGYAARGSDGLAVPVGEEGVGRPDAVRLPPGLPAPILGAGRGFAVWHGLQERLGARLSAVHDSLLPRAQEIARLAVPRWFAGQAVSPDQAQPVYLRNDVARPSRN